MGNRLASVGDDASRAARLKPVQEAPLPNPTLVSGSGAAQAAPFLFPLSGGDADRLGPHGAELTGARPDDRDGLVRQRALAHRPRSPVDRVLEPAGNRAVVLRRREEDRVSLDPRVAETLDRGWRVAAVQVLVVQGQLREPCRVEELDLDAFRGDLGRGPEHLRVVRLGPQAARYGQDLHRQPSTRTSPGP